jgi:hypothetical protein
MALSDDTAPSDQPVHDALEPGAQLALHAMRRARSAGSMPPLTSARFSMRSLPPSAATRPP